jgi:dipeptidyl aminopeptidase/acylaminoacyl peptidase
MRTRTISTILLLFSLPHCIASAEAKRSITVRDIIETTRWANVGYFWGSDAGENVGLYSPDGSHFVIVLRKANLKANTNEYSVYLFTTRTVFRSGRPSVLLRMSSASNFPAIRGMKWLNDNRTLAFIGVHEHDPPQVYTLNIGTQKLTERTRHQTGIDQFDISPDGRRILFTAGKVEASSLTLDQRHHGVVVEDQTLEDIVAGRFNQAPSEESLIYEVRGEEEIAVPPTYQINPNSRLSFSPDGCFASVTAFFRKTSPDWTAYDNRVLQFWGRNPSPLGGASPVSQYFLFDSSKQSIQPLLDAPAVYAASSHWRPDSRAVYLKSFLPISGVSEAERSERVEGELAAEISIPSLTLRRLSSAAWKQTLRIETRDVPDITLEEGPNGPPRLFAHDRRSDRNLQLMNLNPQFSELNFGHVENLHLRVHGIPIIAGLYLPPDYVAGRRYPLVVQTHGYDPKRFSMDGRYEWSSGFAARALAAQGVIVAQMEEFENPADHDKVGSDRSLGRNLEDSFRNFSIDCDQQAIQSLTEKGMIDPDRIGISGFSRTVWFVAYMLTHSEKRFRAAVLTDGIDGGYFEYIAGRLTEFNDDNGGKAPFGRDGLELWMKESPDFTLDRVCIPVRLVSIEDRLAQWEWFISGKLQGKPVELIEIPGGSHMLEMPLDRYIAMQGMVDWFKFWLQNDLDPSPDKRAQYKRWEELRKLESAESNATCSN